LLSLHIKKNYQRSPETHEKPEYIAQSKAASSYKQVSNHTKIQTSYHQIQTPVSQTPIITHTPPNAKQNSSHNFALSIKTRQSGNIPFDSSTCQSFQPKIHHMQQPDRAAKEFSSLQKSSSDPVNIPGESPLNNNCSKLLESSAVKQGRNQHWISPALRVNKHNKPRAEVISGLLSHELIAEKKKELSREAVQSSPGEQFYGG